jgi:serine/threonine protein kinase
VHLTAGTRLGPYEILSPLESGGMGDVYTARDTRLDRIIAIKTSKSQFTERFEREARTVAALNHPNICQLYDVGPDYIVMEYVKGEPIRPVHDVRKLLDLALQIADGLTAAHAAGIVHRDLKPSNLLVTSAGQVKILDFGLAVTTTSAVAASDVTRPARVTETGTTVGTVSYMSPEQARGEAVDARTDLWSLGVVLYELATGVRPFEGPTPAVIFEQLLGKSPVPVRQRNAKIPAEVERVVNRLLEKDLETRYQSAADVRADLKRIVRETTELHALDQQPAGGKRPWRRAAAIAATVTAVLLLAFLAWSAFRGARGPSASPVEYEQLTNFTDSLVDPSLSPDGRMVTFIRTSSTGQFPRLGNVYVKLLPAGESVALTNTNLPKYAPAFTPDGSRVAFTQIGLGGSSATWDTWTVPIGGGQPTRMLPNASGLVWIDEQHVLFSQIMGTGIHMGIVTASTGRSDEREIYFPDHERAMAHYSYLSPDRRSVLIVEMNRSQDFQPCRLTQFDGRSAGTQVGPRGACTAAAWSPDGSWMYFSVAVDGISHLWRQRFPDGRPEQITFGPTEEVGIAVAPDGGSIVTSMGQRRSAIWIHDPQGDRPVSSEGVAFAPRLSEDGRRLYYLLQQNSRDSTFTELRSLELATGKTDRPLPDRSVRQYDISPDEREVVFTTQTPEGVLEIWLATLDRSSPPRRLVQNGDEVSFAGSELVFRELEGKANYLARIRKDGTGQERIVDSPILNKHDTSPDGSWVIAVGPVNAEQTSPPMTSVRPLRGGAPTTLCLGNCGGMFSPDGKWLYVGLLGIGDQPDVGARTLAIPMGKNGDLPSSLTTMIEAALTGTFPPEQSGVRTLQGAFLTPGPDPSTYAYVRQDIQSNLFRIPIR